MNFEPSSKTPMLKSGLEHTCDHKSFVYIIHISRICFCLPPEIIISIYHTPPNLRVSPPSIPGVPRLWSRRSRRLMRSTTCAMKHGPRESRISFGAMSYLTQDTVYIRIHSLRYHHLLRTHYTCDTWVVFQGPS